MPSFEKQNGNQSRNWVYCYLAYPDGGELAHSVSAAQHGACHMLSLTDATTFLASASEDIQ